MALETPSPHALAGVGFSEDRDVVLLGVALDGIVLDLGEDGLEAHDGGGVDHALLAEPGAEESVGVVQLHRAEFADLDPLAVEGDEVPVLALVVLEVKGGGLPLGGSEGS